MSMEEEIGADREVYILYFCISGKSGVASFSWLIISVRKEADPRGSLGLR